MFCLVGFINTAVNYCVFILFLKYFNFPIFGSGAVGYLSGAILGFILNRKFSFRSAVPISTGISTYLIIQFLCLLLHFSIQFFCVNTLRVPDAWSQLPGIIVTTFLNYKLVKDHVFKIRRPQ